MVQNKNMSWALRRILDAYDDVRNAGGWSAICKKNQFCIKLLYQKMRPDVPKVRADSLSKIELLLSLFFFLGLHCGRDCLQLTDC